MVSAKKTALFHGVVSSSSWLAWVCSLGEIRDPGFLLTSLLTYEASRQRYLKPAGEFKASWPPEVHDVKEGKRLSEKQLLHLKIVVP